MDPTTYDRMSKVLDALEKGNTEVINLMKCAEEFQELSLALIHIMTKDTGKQSVIDEMGDCIIRMNLLMRYFDRDKVEKRILCKLEQLEKRMKEKKKKKK